MYISVRLNGIADTEDVYGETVQVKTYIESLAVIDVALHYVKQQPEATPRFYFKKTGRF